ncbi:hypothetical protein M885DRAFT_586854 [Pelagophyceae sp. CCMP2097]|nr:hypothetical protein M885DRAFT_586854 [Pelagophyceae sp. CCMP2097]
MAQQPKTMGELRLARETRASDALSMKDEQLRILNTQNAQLLSSLNGVEEDCNALQLEKLAVEAENRSLRSEHFTAQSEARAARAEASAASALSVDKDKQLRILTDQNSELLRLLETEESQTARLAAENSAFRGEMDMFKAKYATLLTTAKAHEDLATQAAREGQLRAGEVRLLRTEVEQLTTSNSELKLKTQVELETLQEQLRVRKGKQYQLLEKLQASEAAQARADDQAAGMEDKLRQLHAKGFELDTMLQVEVSTRRAGDEAVRQLTADVGNISAEARELRSAANRAESERARMEAEARDSGEQLREMAEKVFQLLERLKLAELGKTRAMEELSKKEIESLAMAKKNARLLKEATKEGRARVKAELDRKVLQDQLRGLKKHNSLLATRCREEVKHKLALAEEKTRVGEKLKTMGGRLAFLLNKMQADEEARVVRTEELRATEARLTVATEGVRSLQQQVDEAHESNRIITQAMRLKQDELLALRARFSVAQAQNAQNEQNSQQQLVAAPKAESTARGHFFVDAKPQAGVLCLKASSPPLRAWLDDRGVNAFLKQAQASPQQRELLVERVGALYTTICGLEDDRRQLAARVASSDTAVEHHSKMAKLLQERFATAEDAKRRTLLRYVHAVKHSAESASVRETSGSIQLPESAIGDEEVHAISALLRGNLTIKELCLPGNDVTDDGAAALATVLAGRSALTFVDLRRNHLTQRGVRVLAEALERSERVRHVYVHADGKIEALGAANWTERLDDDSPETPELNSAVTVETVCTVDCRANESTAPAQLQLGQQLLAGAMSRLGGPNSGLNARIGGLTRSSQLNSDARSLAMRVRGGASGDTGEDVTAAFATALAKRRRDSAPAAVKAGAAGLERDVVQSILCAIDAPPKSPGKSPVKKKPKGRCVDGASVLMTARRGKALHVEVRAAYNASKHEYDFDGEEGAANSICALGGLRHHSPPPGQDAPRAGHHDENDHGPRRMAAALHYVKTIYLVLPWGAVQIFAPHRGNAPHRGDPQTLLLSPDLQIPVDALVCVLTSSRDHYEPLVKRP